MIFQDPLSSMHPFYRVGAQISEAYLVHNKVSRREARKVTVEMLDRVGIRTRRRGTTITRTSSPGACGSAP